MKITVIAVGKLKEKYLREGIDEYLKRLQPYARTEIVELKDEKVPEGMSAAEAERVKAAEGERILERINACGNAYKIALAIEGKMLSSEQLERQLSGAMLSGRSDFVFIIGGSLGLAPEVLKQCDFLLSFSQMTFPHQLMRLILLEQIYRAFKIRSGEPYHK